MIYVYAFLISGAICALAEMLKDFFRLTVGHMTVLFVSLGTLLDFGNFYDRLIQISGAGAMLPITGFGHSLVHAALASAKEQGWIGILTGIYGKTSAGIAFVFVFAVFIGMLFRPKK